MMYRALIATIGLVVAATLPSSEALSSGSSIKEQSISAMFDGSPIVARAANAFGGAISSLTWNGKEFINSSDHGRELQSASSFDGLGESYNPTEAGANLDRYLSTSLVRSLSTRGNVLEGETQMAFWHGGLSQHVLRRKVTIGFLGIPNVIQHLITFVIPEAHRSGTFEALTGYMPPEFTQFYTYDPASHSLDTLSDGPGEQPLPVIFATSDGQYAMGVYSAEPSALRHGGYGRFRFAAQRVVKWNCVYRIAHIAPGEYQTECYSIVGSLEDVKSAIAELHDKTAKPPPSKLRNLPAPPL